MSGGAIAGIVLGGLGLLVGVVGIVYMVSRPTTPVQQALPPPPPPQQQGGGGTDWGALVTGLAGTATSIAGMFV